LASVAIEKWKKLKIRILSRIATMIGVRREKVYVRAKIEFTPAWLLD
jgi:hypothetical protein